MKIIIVGGGQVGTHIAKLLLESKFDVKLIESRGTLLSKLKDQLPESAIVFGEETSHAVLESCGIDSVDMLVAVTGTDETNLVVSTLAKFEYGVPKVLARVNDPKNTWLFNYGMGVDVCLNQADIMAHMIMDEMNTTNLMQLMNLHQSQYSIIQVKTLYNSVAVGKAIKDIAIPQDCLLIAINRGDTVILPKGDIQIQLEDEIIAIVHENQKTCFSDLFNQSLTS